METLNLIFFWVSILYSLFWGLWVFFSIVSSPLAAGICMWLAHRRGLNVLYYGLIGAVYWSFSTLPWLYLMARMSGRRMPEGLTITGYIVLYASWFTLLYAVYMLFLDVSVLWSWLSRIFLSVSVIAAVGSALALIIDRNSYTEFEQNIQPLTDGYIPSSRKLAAGYVVFCLIWFGLLFPFYRYIQAAGHLPTEMVSVFIAVFAVALILMRNRIRRTELEQNIQPFLGGYTLSSRDLIYIAPFALAFVTLIIVAGGVWILPSILSDPFDF